MAPAGALSNCLGFAMCHVKKMRAGAVIVRFGAAVCNIDVVVKVDLSVSASAGSVLMPMYYERVLHHCDHLTCLMCEEDDHVAVHHPITLLCVGLCIYA